MELTTEEKAYFNTQFASITARKAKYLWMDPTSNVVYFSSMGMYMAAGKRTPKIKILPTYRFSAHTIQSHDVIHAVTYKDTEPLDKLKEIFPVLKEHPTCISLSKLTSNINKGLLENIVVSKDERTTEVVTKDIYIDFTDKLSFDRLKDTVKQHLERPVINSIPLDKLCIVNGGVGLHPITIPRPNQPTTSLKFPLISGHSCIGIPEFTSKTTTDYMANIVIHKDLEAIRVTMNYTSESMIVNSFSPKLILFPNYQGVQS